MDLMLSLQMGKSSPIPFEPVPKKNKSQNEAQNGNNFNHNPEIFSGFLVCAVSLEIKPCKDL